jgi:hypothetical protein
LGNGQVCHRVFARVLAGKKPCIRAGVSAGSRAVVGLALGSCRGRQKVARDNDLQAAWGNRGDWPTSRLRS